MTNFIKLNLGAREVAIPVADIGTIEDYRFSYTDRYSVQQETLYAKVTMKSGVVYDTHDTISSILREIKDAN